MGVCVCVYGGWSELRVKKAKKDEDRKEIDWMDVVYETFRWASSCHLYYFSKNLGFLLAFIYENQRGTRRVWAEFNLWWWGEARRRAIKFTRGSFEPPVEHEMSDVNNDSEVERRIRLNCWRRSMRDHRGETTTHCNFEGVLQERLDMVVVIRKKGNAEINVVWGRVSWHRRRMRRRRRRRRRGVCPARRDADQRPWCGWNDRHR